MIHFYHQQVSNVTFAYSCKGMKNIEFQRDVFTYFPIKPIWHSDTLDPNEFALATNISF